MTSIEYAYTERDIYTAIVQTAVPIALTAEETALLVENLIALAARMPHDTPAGVWCAYLHNRGAYESPRARVGVYVPIDWWQRELALARQAADYPSFKGGV